MLRFAVLSILGLAACTASDTGPAFGSGDVEGWRFTSGKAPSHAAYTAVVAACEDGAVIRAQAKPLNDCLADLGLRRAP